MKATGEKERCGWRVGLIPLVLAWLLLPGCDLWTNSSLYEAAYNGDITVVKKLLTKGANPNAKDSRGNTPLHYAANQYHTEIITLLLESGADVNTVGAGGMTALHHAVVDSGPETAKLLLEKGANPNIPAGNGLTPRNIASMMRRSATVEVLEKNSAQSGTLKINVIESGTKAQSTPPPNAKYKMVVFSPEGTEIPELTHYGTEIVQTPHGGTTLVTFTNSQIFPSLQRFPGGARVEIIDLNSKKVIFTHKY